MKFETFDTVITDILSHINDEGQKNYVRMARQLKRTIQNLNLLILPTGVRTNKFVVEDNLTIPLPSDVLSVHKVGAIGADGKINIFWNGEVLNNDLLTGTCSCGSTQDTVSVDTSCPACCFHNFWWNQHYGELYGFYTQKSDATWQLDDYNQRIILKGVEVGDTVFVEYKTSNDELVLIPRDAFHLIQAKTLSDFYRSTNPGLSQMYDLEANRHLEYYKRHHSNWSYDQFYIAMYGSAKAAKY